MRELKVILDRAPRSDDDVIRLSPERSFLLCRAQVLTEPIAAHYLLVLANAGRADELTPDVLTHALAREGAGTVVVVVTESQEGQASATTDPCDETAALEAAASIAVMCASWGWDESAVICVQVNDFAFDIAPRYDGEYWSALASA